MHIIQLTCLQFNQSLDHLTRASSRSTFTYRETWSPVQNQYASQLLALMNVKYWEAIKLASEDLSFKGILRAETKQLLTAFTPQVVGSLSTLSACAEMVSNPQGFIWARLGKYISQGWQYVSKYWTKAVQQREAIRLVQFYLDYDFWREQVHSLVAVFTNEFREQLNSGMTSKNVLALVNTHTLVCLKCIRQRIDLPEPVQFDINMMLQHGMLLH
jgi:hypothetical protein